MYYFAIIKMDKQSKLVPYLQKVSRTGKTRGVYFTNRCGKAYAFSSEDAAREFLECSVAPVVSADSLKQYHVIHIGK